MAVCSLGSLVVHICAFVHVNDGYDKYTDHGNLLNSQETLKSEEIVLLYYESRSMLESNDVPERYFNRLYDHRVSR